MQDEQELRDLKEFHRGDSLLDLEDEDVVDDAAGTTNIKWKHVNRYHNQEELAKLNIPEHKLALELSNLVIYTR